MWSYELPKPNQNYPIFRTVGAGLIISCLVFNSNHLAQTLDHTPQNKAIIAVDPSQLLTAETQAQQDAISGRATIAFGFAVCNQVVLTNPEVSTNPNILVATYYTNNKIGFTAINQLAEGGVNQSIQSINNCVTDFSYTETVAIAPNSNNTSYTTLINGQQVPVMQIDDQQNPA